MTEYQIYKPKLLYKDGAFLEHQAVLVEGGKIRKIGCGDELIRAFPTARVENWEHLVLLPGNINIHNHCFQSLLRGLATDIPFLQWRDEALYRFSPILTPEDLYTGAVFAFGEMMKYGVTTVTDFFYLHNHGIASDEAIIKAARDVGIRLVLARTMYDWAGAPAGYVESVPLAVEHTGRLMEQYNGKDDMVTVIPAPHSLHAASVEMVQAGFQLAKQYGTGYHIHVAEELFEVNDVKQQFGCRPIELLDRIGVLDERMTAVHCVWLDEHEKELMSSRKASLAYCPSSNMFLADGVTDIPYLKQHGVIVALGSDGACSNNRISIYEEMRMTALLQKVHHLDALCVVAPEAYDMGTVNGGLILKKPVGRLKEGYCADFTGVDLEHISMQPLYDNYEQLLYQMVYSMQPDAIRRVVVNGKTTVKDGVILTIPESEIVSRVQEVMKKFQAIQ
ncbi:MAG: amidohydrolase [Lachnospiraceae bacterium]|nr:amidohydrolase [Lachnospiraceae bacterium]